MNKQEIEKQIKSLTEKKQQIQTWLNVMPDQKDNLTKELSQIDKEIKELNILYKK